MHKNIFLPKKVLLYYILYNALCIMRPHYHTNILFTPEKFFNQIQSKDFLE